MAVTRRTIPMVPVVFLPLAGALLHTAPLGAQAQLQETPAKSVSAPAFFDTQEPIEVTLTTNIGRIRGDKGADAPWRPATLSYTGSDGAPVSVPLRARTRGIWRLKMCDFPPMRLNFSGATSKGSIFHDLDKPKLVSYCQDRDQHEQYILEEFQLYRIYQVLTPVSHKARLLKFIYADSGSQKVRAKRYGFIIEEPDAMALRLGGKVMPQKGALPGDLDPYHDALFGVFQYMIGNTDFSESALHNVELFFATDGGVVAPIAYDFDFAGAVNASYAIPDPRLPLQNVRQRLYRGYCTESYQLEKVLQLFKDKKPEIYALYSDPIGKLMDPGTVRSTLKYYDEFYETIDNPRLIKRFITNACIDRN